MTIALHGMGVSRGVAIGKVAIKVVRLLLARQIDLGVFAQRRIEPRGAAALTASHNKRDRTRFDGLRQGRTPCTR